MTTSPPVQPVQTSERAPASPPLPSHSPEYDPPDSPSPTRPLQSSLHAAAYPQHIASPRFPGDFVGLGLWSEGAPNSPRPLTPGRDDWQDRLATAPPSPPRFGSSQLELGDTEYRDEDSYDDDDDHGYGRSYTPPSAATSFDLDPPGPEPDIFSVHLKPRDRPSSSSTSTSSLNSYTLPHIKRNGGPGFSPRLDAPEGASDAEPLLPVAGASTPPSKDGSEGDARTRKRRRFLTYLVVFVVLFVMAAGLANAMREQRVQWGSDDGFKEIDLAAEQLVVEEKTWSKGGDGAVVTMENGATFIYVNQL